MEAVAPQAEADSGRLWENTAARSAILTAARRVAEREGILEMSLTAVAAEAGVAPASVYAEFGSKNDLLQGVVADDLATLAQAMHGAIQVPQVAPSAPLDTGSGSGNANAADALHKEPAGASEAKAIAHLQKTVAMLEQRPVDAWLERRLREFERSLSVIEGRQSDKNTVEQNIEDRYRRLGQNVESLEQRLLAIGEETAQRTSKSLDACETRLRQLVSDAQGDFKRLDRRLTAVENAAFAARPELFPPAPEIAPQTSGTVETEPVAVPAEGASAEPIAPGTAPAPYLDVARQSAQAAAQTQIKRARQHSRRKSETMIYLAMGLLFLLVAMLTAMGFMLRNQAMNETAQAAAGRAPEAAGAPRHLVQRMQSSPLARLAALAQSGNPDAELLIGLGELNVGHDRNATAAFQWLSRAAAHKQTVAQYQLGLMYRNGRGVGADAAQAFHWFESAALGGNRKAMHSLATSYAEGWGTQKDLTEAARWFERAAAQGLVNDEFNLGVLYERGMGVPQNLVDAYKWYAIAAAQGDRESAARIAALAPTLSADDLAAARDAAASFKPDQVSAAANDAPDPARLR